ncbi:MAG: hypothetical protein ICV54_06955 [Nostoc sp. C3-bin3]|nr:hypothetical protein [Nostoc sp. C3-bin3]
MIKRDFSTNSRLTRPSTGHLGQTGTTGRLNNLEFEKKKIEINQGINYQQVRGLEAKHEEEKIKADEAWIKTDIASVSLETTKVNLEIAETDLQLTEVKADLKLVELGMAEDRLSLLEIRAGLEHNKSVAQLQGMSIEIDEVNFQNDERKKIGEYLGVNHTTRAFPVQNIKAFLKEGLSK